MVTTAILDFDGTLAPTLECLMIKDYLSVILSAEDVTYRKPDARLYTDSIAPLLSSPVVGGVLVVGDTESDLLFARNAGLKSCWAAYGYGDPETCLALKPDFVIAEIKELQGILRA